MTKIIKDYSSEEIYAIISKAMTRTGMDKHILRSRRDDLVRLEEEINSEYPGLYDTDKYKWLFWTRQPLIRDILENDTVWMSRWVSDESRVCYVSEVCENFLRFGHDALPGNYKYAEQYGAIFRFDEGADTELICYTRGTGKTHTHLSAHNTRLAAKYPKFKWLLGAGVEHKAKDNLSRIQQFMMSPELAAVFPDIFADDAEFYKARGTKMLRSRINIVKIDVKNLGIMYDGTNIRGEWTYNLFTPEMDVVGGHWNGTTLDDFVTQDNSGSEERQKKIISIFNSLGGLEEYFWNEDGTMFGFPKRLLGTQWWTPNLYTYILDNKSCRAFIIPCAWDPEPNKYWYDRTIRLDDRIVSDAFIKRKLDEYKEWAPSQLDMMPRPRDGELSLGFTEDDVTFKWLDEIGAPENVSAAPLSLDLMKTKAAAFISKDMAYSIDPRRQKDEGSSKDTVIAGFYYNSIYYIAVCTQTAGVLSMSEQVRPIIAADNIVDTDVIVLDAQGLQEFAADQIITRLQKILDGRFISYRKHKGVKQSDGKGKAMRAATVLGSLFSAGLIKIHWRLRAVLDELARNTSGFDIIDALVQICSISSRYMQSIVDNKEFMRESQEEVNNKDSRNNTVFRTTDY